MDYEKEYKEARERATKVIMKCRPLSTEANLAVHYALSYVFPATTETEDERIRKEIIDFLTDGIWNTTVIDKVKQSQRYAKWIAYLEMQKEQKPTKWIEGDERMLEPIISDLRELCNCETDEELISDYEDRIAWLESLRPQPHWKPSEEQMKALKHCVDGWQDNADGILDSLYNDLKTL